MSPNDRHHEAVPAELDWCVLDRYLAGEPLPDEVAQIDRWTTATATSAIWLRALQDPASRGVVRRARDVDGRWTTFLRRHATEATDGELPTRTPTTPTRVRSAHWQIGAHTLRATFDRDNAPRMRGRTIRGWAMTAGAVLAAVAVTLFVVRRPIVSERSPLATQSYTTTTGQQAVLTLEDGTRVTLAPRTTLRVLTFDAHSRIVTLLGEAYFDVSRAVGTPFIVQTGGVSTHVLGTGFVVRRYRTDSHVRVAVLTGKVSVTAESPQRPSIMLGAGDVGDVTDSSATMMSTTDMTPYAGWLNGQLAFHKAPVPEILNAMSRWYGYEFRLSDSTLATRNLTAVLSTQSAEAALSTLKLLLDVDLTFQGPVITLTPRHAARMPTQERRDSQDMFHPYTSEVGR